MKTNRGLVEVGVALAVFLLLWPGPSFAGDYWLQIAFRVLIYLTLAESWNLLAGSAGLVSLGTSCFVGVGAYVAFALMNGLDARLRLWLASASRRGRAGRVRFAALFGAWGSLFAVGTLKLAARASPGSSS